LRKQALSTARTLLPRLLPALLLSVLLLPALLVAAGPAAAAQLQQVRSATLLQVGDGNRSYRVALACVSVEPNREATATAWLRQQARRGTQVNLRPLGSREGVLLARVQILANRREPPMDLGEALVAQGLAKPLPDADPVACAPR
jgi:hypothetical protein